MKMKIVGIMICLLILVNIGAFATGQQEAATQAAPDLSGTEKYNIDIYTFTTASSTYIMGVALAELINKHSTWLTANALASDSLNGNANVLINEKPTTAIGCAVLHVLYGGYAPFKEPNQDLQYISTFVQPSNCYMTLDPDIKTVKDFEGKKVMLGPPGGYFRNEIPKVMFEYIGVEPKFSYGGFADSIEALIGGQADVILGGGTAISPNLDKWNFSTYTKLLTQFDVKFVSIDPDGMDYGMKKYKFETEPGPIKLAPGDYYPSWQEELIVNSTSQAWVCNKAMPSEVITEILTIIVEHADEFGNYSETGKWTSPQNVAKVPNPEWINETAKRFYIEHGLWSESN